MRFLMEGGPSDLSRLTDCCRARTEVLAACAPVFLYMHEGSIRSRIAGELHGRRNERRGESASYKCAMIQPRITRAS